MNLTDTSMVLYSSLDSAAKVTTPEKGGSGYLNGSGANFISAGKCGGAAQFPASGSYGLKFPYANSLWTEGSVDLWYKPNDNCAQVGTTVRYLVHRPPEGHSFSLTVVSNAGTAELQATYGHQNAGTPFVAKVPFVCNPNIWVHIFATWNANGTGANVVTLDILGPVGIGIGAGPGPLNGGAAGGSHVYVGAKSGYNSYADGTIDEIKFYDKQLTPPN